MTSYLLLLNGGQNLCKLPYWWFNLRTSKRYRHVFLRHSMCLGVFKFMSSLRPFTIIKLISLINVKTILISSIHQRCVTKCQNQNIEKGFGVESVTSRFFYFLELKVKTKGLIFTQNKMELLFSIRNIINKKQQQNNMRNEEK